MSKTKLSSFKTFTVHSRKIGTFFSQNEETNRENNCIREFDIKYQIGMALVWNEFYFVIKI